jgi:hypothetical protein
LEGGLLVGLKTEFVVVVVVVVVAPVDVVGVGVDVDGIDGSQSSFTGGGWTWMCLVTTWLVARRFRLVLHYSRQVSLTSQELSGSALYLLSQYATDSGHTLDYITLQTLWDCGYDTEGCLVVQQWDVPSVPAPTTAELKAYSLDGLEATEHLWEDYRALRHQSKVLATYGRLVLTPYADVGNLIFGESGQKLYTVTNSGWVTAVLT